MNGNRLHARPLQATGHAADVAANASLTSAFDSAIAIALAASIASGCRGEVRLRSMSASLRVTNEPSKMGCVRVRNDAGIGLR